MDTEDAPVGRVTELVGAGGENIWEATDDRTAKLKRIEAGKVFGGWACYACNNLHSEFEYMDVVCDECGADRVALIAGPVLFPPLGECGNAEWTSLDSWWSSHRLARAVRA